MSDSDSSTHESSTDFGNGAKVAAIGAVLAGTALVAWYLRPRGSWHYWKDGVDYTAKSYRDAVTGSGLAGLEDTKKTSSGPNDTWRYTISYVGGESVGDPVLERDVPQWDHAYQTLDQAGDDSLTRLIVRIKDSDPTRTPVFVWKKQTLKGTPE